MIEIRKIYQHKKSLFINIPKNFHENLNWKKGDTIILILENNELRLVNQKDVIL